MPTVNVRPRTLRRRLALVGMGGLLAAAVASMPVARADGVAVYTEWKATAICGWFDMHPVVGAVQPMFTAIQEDTRYSNTDTARVLVDAVWGWCPVHMDVLREYGNQATHPAGVFIS